VPDSDRTFDAIVVGVGTMGAATCLALARRGQRVLGLEQHRIGHDLGSSHGGSRIVRDCYFEAPDYVPLLLRCREGWERLERDSGERIVHRCGVLYLGAPESEVIRESARSGSAFDVPFESLDSRGVRARFPQFEMPEDWHAIFEPGAGFARPERAVRAASACAARLGAAIREGVRVSGWQETPRGVRVQTDRGDYESGALVLAAGAWTGGLARALGVSMVPLRVPIAWLQPRDETVCRMPTMPVWYVDRPGQSGLYGVPIAPDQGSPGGVKVAMHGGGTVVDPDASRRLVSQAELEAIRVATETFLPCAAGGVSAGSTCLYTMSPDSHFVLDRMPGCEKVFVACGFSGHGFKFMPVMGEVLADLATCGSTDLPVGFLGVGRFGTGS
jgi:sarcosine oxidase